MDNRTSGYPSAEAVLPLSADADRVSQNNPPPARPIGKDGAKNSRQSQDNLLEGQLALARLCERRGESEQAKQFYRALLEKSPQDPRPHHRLGILAVQKLEFAQAEEHFRAARSLAPATADLLSDIGYCYYLQQKLTEAEDVLDAALDLDPNHSATINNLALVAGAQGRYGESLALFKRVNSEAEAYANLGYVLSQNGELAKAEDMYRRALTLDNTLRVAAQAMLQVRQRRRSQASLELGDRQSIAGRSDSGPVNNAPLPPSADPDQTSDTSRPVKASFSAPRVAEVPSPAAGMQSR
jgi:Flp pilus assembly protein TadD